MAEISIAELRPVVTRAIDDIKALSEKIQQGDASISVVARSVETSLLHLKYAQDNISKLTADVEKVERELTEQIEMSGIKHAQALQTVLQTAINSAVQTAMQSVVQIVQAAKEAEGRAAQAATQAAQADAKVTALQATLQTSEESNAKMRIASRKQLIALAGTILTAIVSLIVALATKG